ncbi:ABC transporter ATP-binding protein [Anaerocolumna sp. AGMB13020]|uniref:ABC transporter ATP-binding protein n=1 Tax=Anaerocolumna sp. AGMB13020 TaxID=3081750 RepID=UPI002952CF2F|nr:ABC transporter ATP-binding protein [Anaerocolumna sp. AGMB13020]WOO38157.1 ABC transporter ATP-binding protein [Anaerocolumna sp. AGMB13020]
MNAILECKGVNKSYSGLRVLKDINLTLERGRITGLLGPNGSGKSTFIKLINGLLVPDSGDLLINGFAPGIETKRCVSYLPERNYLADWMHIKNLLDLFRDFYADFDIHKALEMLKRLNINPELKLKTLSKGTKEKVQLILVMSRKADLYCLDEPIGGVDPAARDYILNTIITNYNENATVLISTHLIAEVEKVLDDVIFIQNGSVLLHSPVDEVRNDTGKSIDSYFREVYKC